GIAAFKLYFMPKHDAETDIDTTKHIAVSAPDREDSALENIQESVKEKPDYRAMAQPQTVPNLHRGPLIGEGSEKKENYQKKAQESFEEQIEKRFQKKEGSHFTIKFEGGENSDIGYLISILLEEAYIKVGSDIGYYPEDRIEAVLYTQQQFTDVTRAPNWAGAIYDGRIKIPIGGVTSRTSLLERALFHEYTHALVHRLSKGRAPVWLNEGIAQHEEGAANENINQILAQITRSEKPIPLRPFEGSFIGYNNMQASVAYSVSLSATEYIINEFGISAVRRILENLGNGKTLEEAISSSLYISYEDLQGIWFMSLKRKFAD
ncbi:MAG: peptidase MA family metallohydrolase, partial [Deltaproteobacteria bacterium]